MRRLLSLVLAIVLIVPVLAGHSLNAEALGDIWVANYYKDSFGDNTDTCYITNRKVFKGTYKDDGVNNGKLEAAIVVDAESLSFMLTLGKKGTLKNLGLEPVGYSVSVKDTNGQVYSFTGVMMGQDDRIYINAESKKTVISILSGKGVVGIFIEQDKIHNYTFKADCGNFFELYDQVFAEPIRASGYEVATYALEHKDYDVAIRIFEEYIDYRDCRQKLAEAKEAKNADAYLQAERLLAQDKYDEAVEAFRALGEYRDSSLRIEEVYEAKNADAYARAKSLLDQKKYDEAAEAFRALGEYKDSAHCVEVVYATQKADMYYAAEVLQAQGKYDEAIEAFESLGNFGDCKQRIEAIQEMQKAETYSRAEELLELKRFDDAYQVFRDLGEYKDSQTRKDEVLEAKKADAYLNAEILLEKHDYDEAIEAFKALGAYRDSRDRVEDAIEMKKASQYEAADSLYQAGNYQDSYKMFSEIKGYKDVDERLSNDRNLQAVRNEIIKPYKTVGNTVFFGTYEQDGDISNGEEKIEWIVLDTEGNKSLLFSKVILDLCDYGSCGAKEWPVWENSNLRRWLNSSFLYAAFTLDERSAIVFTDVDNSVGQGNRKFEAPGSNNTEDQIFALSFAELNKYLKNKEDRKCTRSWAVFERDSDHSCWSLRSPGYWHDNVMVVNTYTGSLEDAHSPRYLDGVRPALWIDVDSDFFY